MIVGADCFIDSVRTMLTQLGFSDILTISDAYPLANPDHRGIIIEYVGDTSVALSPAPIPVIYPFDFIKGAGVIVFFPDDDREMLPQKNLRLWAAQYMVGYSAFWRMEGCGWLSEVLPAIRAGHTSEEGMNTAAYMSVKIATNIAVGREVKRFPRFYLAESNQWRAESE